MNLLNGKQKTSEMPIIWMMIDEAHMFMPRHRESIAQDVLLNWIRVGRQPGLSLLLATQRPNFKMTMALHSNKTFFGI